MKAVAIGLLLASALVLPSVANTANPFDGKWSVHAKADPGTCDDNYGMSIEVAGGRVKYHGLVALVAKGSVSASGAITMRVGEARVDGKLATRSGGGRWASPNCHGAWTATRA